MLSRLRRKLAAFLVPPIKRSAQQRMYAIGRPSRTTSGWGTSTSSEDAELNTSLRLARDRSRQLVRDASYAKRAKVIVQNNIIGGGIGLQANVETSRGDLNERVNDEIEAVWEEWCEAAYCHTGASLNFSDLERLLIGENFEAGEILVRKHFSRFGGSKVPLALEVIEPECIADQYRPSAGDPANSVRLGIEVDSFLAPQAYWIKSIHPGDLGMPAPTSDRLERVPAEFIEHLRLIERWPQTRAIPWMHAAARKLNDMDGLTEAEITAARAAACYMGIIETPQGDGFDGEEQPDGSLQMELEPAVIQRLAAGEKFSSFVPNRPNTQVDPFMRMMLREAAAGTGPSYESLSRDYSQSNYSSSRLALMDDRDLWRMLQLWYIRFRRRLHKVWLRQAVLAGAIKSINIQEYAANPAKFEAVRFKPRGWSWIDPQKEVLAYELAIRNGFTTVSRVIAQTADGWDLEDILKERKRELDLMQKMGLKFDTDPSTVKDPNRTAVLPGDTEGQLAEADAAVQAAEKMLRTHRAKLEAVHDVF